MAPGLWVLLERLAIIFGIVGIVLTLARWMVKKVRPKQVLALLAWAIVGEADEEKLILTVGNVAKWAVALLVWGIIGVIVALIFANVLDYIFDVWSLPVTSPPGTRERFTTLGAVSAAVFRATWPLFRRIRLFFVQLRQDHSRSN